MPCIYTGVTLGLMGVTEQGMLGGVRPRYTHINTGPPTHLNAAMGLALTDPNFSKNGPTGPDQCPG